MWNPLKTVSNIGEKVLGKKPWERLGTYVTGGVWNPAQDRYERSLKNAAYNQGMMRDPLADTEIDITQRSLASQQPYYDLLRRIYGPQLMPNFDQMIANLNTGSTLDRLKSAAPQFKKL